MADLLHSFLGQSPLPLLPPSAKEGLQRAIALRIGNAQLASPNTLDGTLSLFFQTVPDAVHLKRAERRKLHRRISAEVRGKAPFIPSLQTLLWNIFPPLWLRRSTLSLGGFCLGLMILSAGAEAALPGDLLYPLKIHLNEPLQFFTRPTEESRASWMEIRVERRMREAFLLQRRHPGDRSRQELLLPQMRRSIDAAEGAAYAATLQGNSATGLERQSRLEATIHTYARLLDDGGPVRTDHHPSGQEQDDTLPAEPPVTVAGELRDIERKIVLLRETTESHLSTLPPTLLAPQMQEEHREVTAARERLQEELLESAEHITPEFAEKLEEAKQHLQAASEEEQVGNFIEAIVKTQSALRLTRETEILFEVEKELSEPSEETLTESADTPLPTESPQDILVPDATGSSEEHEASQHIPTETEEVTGVIPEDPLAEPPSPLPPPAEEETIISKMSVHENTSPPALEPDGFWISTTEDKE